MAEFSSEISRVLTSGGTTVQRRITTHITESSGVSF